MNLIETIEQYQLVVAVRTETPEKAYQAAVACIKGGIRLVEITFSVPGAEEVIRELNQKTRAYIGAGTILSISDLKKALKAGAKYIVSPNLDEEIVRSTKNGGAISIPGACTPTEIYRAYRSGGDIIKLFPFVEMGGLNFLKAIRGPMPFVRFMLSGGVNLNNISEYLAAKASCILIGSSILKKELVDREDWASISDIARRFAEKMKGSLSPRRNPPEKI